MSNTVLDPATNRRPSRWAIRAVIITIAATNIVCVDWGGGGDQGSTQGGAVLVQYASGTVDSSGGKVEVTDSSSPIAGTSVEVPAGAVSTPTTITIGLVQNSPDFPPSSLPIDFDAEGVTSFSAAVTLRIKYSDQFLADTGLTDESELFVFSIDEASGEVEMLNPESRDSERNLITVTTTHFSTHFVADGVTVVSWFEKEWLVDPTQDVRYTIVPVKSVPLACGLSTYTIPYGFRNQTASVRIGKGTKESFFSGNKRNVVLVHGIWSSALTFQFADGMTGPNLDDLLGDPDSDTGGLRTYYDNILCFQYRSKSATIESIARQLVSELQQGNADTGFRTDIIAHSMGGLVARYAIEKLGLSAKVGKLVTIGTPHAGVSTWVHASNWYPCGLELDRSMEEGVQFLSCLNGAPDATCSDGSSPAFNGTPVPYFLIAGDAGDGTDKWPCIPDNVAVGSALGTDGLKGAFQLGGDDQSRTFGPGTAFQHTSLHTRASSNGVLAAVVQFLIGSGGVSGDTTPPTITITSPTSDPSYSTPSSSITLGGSANDNIGVASVRGSNAATGEIETASGTTSWSVSVSLNPGANAITLTAADTAGNTSSDTITVTYTTSASDITDPSFPPGASASATADSSTQITLTWTAATDNVTPSSNIVYLIYYSTVSYAAINFTAPPAYTTNPDVTTHPAGGLNPSTTYYFTILPKDQAGNVPGSGLSASATTPAAPATSPTSPTGLAVTAVSASEIDVVWVDNSGNEDGFRIERAPDGGGVPGTFAEIFVTTANATTYPNTGLDASTTYWYRVRAYNAVGNSAYSNDASATTLAPPPAGSLGSWQATQQMDVDRIARSAVVHNSWIYVTGSGRDTVGKAVLRAPINPDGSVGSWVVTQDLLTYRGNHGSVAINGFLYILGGGTSTNSFTNDVQFAPINTDGSLGGWSSTTGFTTGRTELAAVGNAGTVYVIGGRSSSSTYLGNVQYAPTNVDGTITAWTATTPLPTSRALHAAVVMNGHIYVLGGRRDVSAPWLDTVVFSKINPDGSLGPWNTATSFVGARRAHQVAGANGYIYLIGGETSVDGTVNDVQYAQGNPDGTLGTWAATTPFVTKRSYHGAVLHNGRIYVLGGYYGGGTKLKDVQFAPILP